MSERYLVGLIGAGIGASLSPALHEREADRLGLRLFYQLIDLTTLGAAPDDIGDLVRDARRLGFRGLNITHPCKQEVVKHLDALSPGAAELQAVNTVVFHDGRATGHNTDRDGFAEGFRQGLPGARLAEVVQLGAGGAGHAVAYAISRLGVGRLTLIDPDEGRAEGLAQALRERGLPARSATPDRLGALLADADGLINASPVGMAAHPGLPVPEELLHAGLWVTDIIYSPLRTGLLRAAAALGCRTLNGGGMVVHQAAAAFELFTGHRPDVAAMTADFTALAAEELAAEEPARQEPYRA
ncbi:shikimate dehydrogenase [Winogradskya consettensis]|uniref:Shikimate dehydrogenase (NADP(+)) n=1 Tax=Winogradskya consettensis TaxID=113560 RepID=A0A919VPF6_9ACTN|nr:shikimate dehydrogenase [Actinoplanes consettensis]GIM71097.1 shikimate dehydrogenase (NADP(+)) [Actinoplanes consettensis]